MVDYLLKETSIEIDNNLILVEKDIEKAVRDTNIAIRELQLATNKFDINIFKVLGLRNLSGLVGEYFAALIQRNSHGNIVSNPHQDGYPDLLLTLTNQQKEYFKEKTKNNIIKEDFSPYLFGGIEVKATCGNIPSSAEFDKKNLPRPDLGDQRIEYLKKMDWKAHHRETNFLLAILWDFIDGYPQIVACFYSDSLTEDDWGAVIKPKNNDSRTTSVSIMNKKGIDKMCSNWILVMNEEKYISTLSEKKFIGTALKKYIVK